MRHEGAGVQQHRAGLIEQEAGRLPILSGFPTFCMLVDVGVSTLMRTTGSGDAMPYRKEPKAGFEIGP